MSTDQEPNFYQMMLGLPKDQTAPNHYQLIGVPPFTEDVQAIRNASADQNGKLMYWQNSAYYKAAGRLMLELAVARGVLLDPAKKQAYDHGLNRDLAETIARETVSQRTQATTKLPPLPPLSPTDLTTPEDQQAQEFESVWNDRRFQITVGATATILVLLIMMVINRSSKSPEQPQIVQESSQAQIQTASIPVPVFEPVPSNPVLNEPPPQEPLPPVSTTPQPTPAPMPSNDTLIGTKAGEEWNANGLGMVFCWCPPGTFQMGSPAGDRGGTGAAGNEQPQHEVRLTQGFWLGQTEVTQGQWQQVMNTTPWKGKSYVQEGSDYPANYVSWDDAMAFCKKLTEQEQQAGHLPAGVEYTLPTEAQWEYACRAGTTTKYSFGDDESQLNIHAWWGGISGNGNANAEQHPHPVGQKTANPWGLFDVHGNLWEWCADQYDSSYYNKSPMTDPQGASSGLFRVRRGGGWSDSAWDCLSADRRGYLQRSGGYPLGFRVARVSSSPLAQTSASPKPTNPQATASSTQSTPSAFAGTQAGEEWNANGLGMTFCWCPPGTFQMGSPPSEKGRQSDEDQVRVTLTQGFWLGKREVTQGEWQQVMGTTPWQGQEYVKEGSDYPASYVSWDDAIAFCQNLTSHERQAGRLPEGWEFTVPTEAQWEYACRAGTTTAFSFGTDETKLGDYGWYGGLVGNGNAINERYAHAAGQLKTNPWGLQDVHGNVWEWCRGWYASTLSGGRDPETTKRSSYRVYRGSSWSGPAKSARSASRFKNTQGNRDYYLGFRVARVLSGPSP